MTREEAIITLRTNVMVACDTSDKVGYGTPLNKAIEQALNMAIKSLEQEPCEDCVSRKAIDQNIYDYAESNGLSYANMKNYILDVPPVIPTRKKGEWIKEMSLLGWDGRSYQCSECGRSIHLDTEVEDLIDYPYCHCGTEMEIDEEMESEDGI